MQSCFLLKPAVFFAFLTLYVGTAIHIKSSKFFGVTGAFGYYVKVYREAETLARTSVCPTPATNFQNNLVVSDGKSVTKEDIHETLRFNIGGIGQFLGRV